MAHPNQHLLTITGVLGAQLATAPARDTTSAQNPRPDGAPPGIAWALGNRPGYCNRCKRQYPPGEDVTKFPDGKWGHLFCHPEATRPDA